jgi:glycosyltransferase involved in cell wall biosynthesis
MQEKRFDVSFIVPVYNAEDSVLAALTGIVRQQTNLRFEVIVVNDGSTDRSLQRIEQWVQQEEYDTSRIAFTLLHQENRGEAAAMNTGMAQASAPLIAWVESDVCIAPDWLSRLIAALQEDTVAGAGGVLYPAEDEPFIAALFGYEITYKIQTNNSSPRHITSANALYKKKIFDEVGPCREALGESSFDSEINQRIRDAGYGLRCPHEATARHRFKTKLWPCLIRAGWYGFRRPFVSTQVLYDFDRVIGVLVLLSGLLYPALLGCWWWPWPALAVIGVVFLAHVAYSFFLFLAFRDTRLLLGAPVYLLRNAIFILAYGCGWIAKNLGRAC